jgi:hypothetical protein
VESGSPQGATASEAQEDKVIAGGIEESAEANVRDELRLKQLSKWRVVVRDTCHLVVDATAEEASVANIIQETRHNVFEDFFDDMGDAVSAVGAGLDKAGKFLGSAGKSLGNLFRDDDTIEAEQARQEEEKERKEEEEERKVRGR